MSVLSLTDAKAHLNISGTPTNLGNAELQAIIDAAESLIGTQVGPLDPEPVIETVRAGFDGSLLLSRYPVASLTSVAPYGGTPVDLASVDTRGGVVTFLSGRLVPGAYTVAYQAGWSDLPDALLFAVKELVRHFVATQRGGARRPGSAPSDTVANTVPGAAYALPIRVEQLIAPYHSPRVA